MDLPDGIQVIENDYSSYRPLSTDSREIRLLHLFHNPETATISAELEHYSLNSTECPSYVALSYHWGDLSDLREIVVNDTLFRVTSNLEAALQRVCLDRSRSKLVTMFGIECKVPEEGGRTARSYRAEYKRLKTPPSKLRWTALPSPKVSGTADMPQGQMDASETLTDVYLWVDAICINQLDVKERSSQVAMMLDVYTKAEKVFAWLGDDDHCNETLDNCFHNIVLYVSSTMNTAGQSVRVVFGGDPTEPGGTTLRKLVDDAKARAMDEDLRTRQHGPHHSSEERHEPAPILDSREENDELASMLLEIPIEQLEALRSVFTKAWFRRLWVLQEIWAAKNAEAGFGDAIISWDLITLACRWVNFALDKLQGYRSSTAMTLLNEAKLSQIWQILVRTRNESEDTNFLQVISCSDVEYEESLNALTLRQLLNLTTAFQCLDARDRFYALLSISADFRQTPDHLRPDYSKPAINVLCDYAAAMIDRSKSLDLLADIRQAPPSSAVSINADLLRYSWQEAGINIDNPQDPDVFEAWFHAMNERLSEEVERQHRNKLLPTWVPDWRTRSCTNHEPFTAFDHVAIDAPPLTRYLDQRRVLQVGGHFLQPICYVSFPFDKVMDDQIPSMTFRTTPEDDEEERRHNCMNGAFLIPLWLRMCDTVGVEPDLERVALYMISLVYLGLPIEQGQDLLISAPQKTRSLPTTDPTIEADFAALWEAQDPKFETMPEDARDHFLPQARHGSAGRFAKAVQFACEYRCFCITVRGFLGVCDPSAKPGDLVTILLGGPSLYLLRCSETESEDETGDSSRHFDTAWFEGDWYQEGKSYKYVGECNIYPLSSARTLKIIEENERPMNVFNLV